MNQEEKIKLAQLDQELHVIKNTNPERYNRIVKAFNDIQKARAGFYQNTPENRKLGRVGMSYGTQKVLNELNYKTKDRFFKDGKWSRQRHKDVHKKIILSTLKNGKSQEKPTVVLLMGGTASGKSSVSGDIIKGIKGGDESFVHLDVDAVKQALPEYSSFSPSEAANNTHNESSYLGDTMRKLAVNNKYNFVNDGTFSKMDKALELIGKLKKQGYKIHLINVTVDIDEAKKREDARFKRSGRKVKTDILESSHIGAVDVYDKIKGLVDDYSLLDNNVPFGQKANLIDSKSKGVTDNEAYKRFVAKKNYKRTA